MPTSAVTDRRFEPLPVLQFDLHDVDVDRCARVHDAYVLVRYHREPLGIVRVSPEQGFVTRALVLEAIERDDGAARRMATHRLIHDAHGLAGCPRFALTGRPPSIAVVIPTRDRPESLRRCLESLALCAYEDFEVIVVDNASRSSHQTRKVVDEFSTALRIRNVWEGRAGASRARNTGTSSTECEIVAFCDDDVVVDCMWLHAIAHRFEVEPEAQCITGLVVPGEIETPAQLLFEEYGGFGKGSTARSFDLGPNADSSPLFPWTAGRFGSGNNVAYRRTTLVAVGGYDELLGPGTPTHAGEDLDLFVRLVLLGHRIAYEPAALVAHFHRRSMPELTAQIRDYGIGLSAMLCLRACSQATAAASIARRVVPGARLLLSTSSAKNAGRSTAFPRELARAELDGVVRGPVALLRARHQRARTETHRIGPRLRAHLAQPMFRNAWALVLNTAVTGILGIAYWAVAARLYPAPAVGGGAAMIAAMAVLSGIAQLNLIAGLPRFLPTAGRLQRRLVLSGYAVTAGLAIVIASGFVTVNRLTGLGGDFLDGPASVRVWFIAAVAAWTIFTLQDAVLAGLRAAIWVPVENGLFAVSKIVLAVAFLGAFPRYGIFASWTIPVLCSLVPVNLLIFRRLLPVHERAGPSPSMRRLTARVARLVAGDYPGSLAYLASITAMPIIVARVVGFEQAAYFYTAWMLATSSDMVLSAIATSATVEGAHDVDGFSKVVDKAIRLYTVILLPLVVILVFGAHTILAVFGTGYQTSATHLLQLVALTLPARAIVHLAFAGFRIEGRPRAIFAVQLASALGLLGGTLLLISVWGITGVGVSYFFTQWTVALLLIPAIRRRRYCSEASIIPLESEPQLLTVAV
jgi:GT2 family glycosyltransferase/O-antigen/teichoic acid export membrane protein